MCHAFSEGYVNSKSHPHEADVGQVRRPVDPVGRQREGGMRHPHAVDPALEHRRLSVPLSYCTTLLSYLTNKQRALNWLDDI